MVSYRLCKIHFQMATTKVLLRLGGGSSRGTPTASVLKLVGDWSAITKGASLLLLRPTTRWELFNILAPPRPWYRSSRKELLKPVVSMFFSITPINLQRFLYISQQISYISNHLQQFRGMRYCTEHPTACMHVDHTSLPQTTDLRV